MSRTRTRPRPCDKPYGDARFDKAEVFAQHATLDPYSERGADRSAAVSNAVLAGIAAADAICCNELGKRSSSSDHDDAIKLLASVPRIGRQAADNLWDMLNIKHKAQYTNQHPTLSETKRVIRAMTSLMNTAESYR